MKEYSVLMALMDMLPVGMFATGAIMLQRDLYNKMSKGAFALFATGTINIICSGFLKALYKLLYALGICDFEVLSKMFFPTMSIGFWLAGLGMIAMICHKQGKDAAYAVAPPLFTGTFLFVGFIISGLALLYVGMGIIAVKLKRKWLIPVLIIGFFCMLGMGYLSSKDFSEAFMNWVAEGTNFAGQGIFLLSVIVLRKAGLRNLKLQSQ